MKISIIIPVYNEADQLSDCLDSIAALSIKPHEVIVVDNNSSDETASIAEQYSFVRLINEAKQGVVHARKTGFDLASGDIIARIDGDTILPRDWIDNIQDVFSDPSLDAASGVAMYYGVAADNVINAVDLFFRRRLSRQLKDRIYLWGANMAIRKDAWGKVRLSLCQRGDLHEDFDIAIHLQAIGCNVSFDERLKAYVSSRRIDTGFITFMRYVMVSPRTYSKHGVNVKRYMYPVVFVCALGYVPGYLLHRGYDEQIGRFSWVQLLLAKTEARVDPTANVV
jgi:glycosyltransferase involved in cell wall biosynthesis